MKAIIWISSILLVAVMGLGIWDCIDAATVTHGQVVGGDHQAAWVETQIHNAGEGTVWTSTIHHPEVWTIIIMGTNSHGRLRERTIEVSEKEYGRWEMGMEWPDREGR